MSLSQPKTVLGQQVAYPDRYDPSLLRSIPRIVGRNNIGLGIELPFTGTDRWNCYELTWLNQRGQPMVAQAQLICPVDSPNLIESKSLKLYLMGFSGEKFDSAQQLVQAITCDITAAVSAPVVCSILLPKYWPQTATNELKATSIDDLDVTCTEYERNPGILSCGGPSITEKLVTDLFRSVCPVTGQPDYASVLIEYKGSAISHESLVRYITSFRNHPGFHEECCEMIFMDILEHCKPAHLLVACNFTRRGGIDINPLRKNRGCPFEYGYARAVRQ
jgi:7-cyano-7-deazaguanine reductase